MQPQTSSLDGAEWALMREQVAGVQALVAKRYGAPPFNQSLDDLAPLQRLIDERVFDETQLDELRALGVVFGNVLAKHLGFEWVAAVDGREREPALKLKPTGALVIKPLAMIVAPASSGARVDLARIVEQTKAQAASTKLLPKIR